ncbi:MAG: insulinase family protein [Thaumarchaeota archaeon]|nr:insulinase family protein [Nitrososphaerota archaeon]
MKIDGGVDLKQERLQNGISLISNETADTETVAISGSIKSGAICDTPGMFGTAELVARLLTRGTKNKTAGQISQSIEELGATLSFENRDEAVSFSARCYYGVLDQILELIGECLTEPNFPETEITLSKSEILSDLKSQEDDTRASAYRGLNSLIFGKDQPYGRDPLGRPADLDRLTKVELVKFHEENYNPATVIFGITGRYDFAHVLNKIEKVFTDWSGSQPPKQFGIQSTELAPEIIRIEMKHKTQVDLALGAKAIPRSSPLYYSLNLGNLILGRLGLYGRLGKNVREEKGLAYYAFSILQAKLFSGQIGIYAGVNPKNVDQALTGIVEEIDRIATEAISDSELTTAKRNLWGSLSLSLDTAAERVGLIHDIAYYQLGLDYLERYPKILEGISSDYVLQSCKQMFNPDRISLVAAGPLEDSELKLPKDLLKA